MEEKGRLDILNVHFSFMWYPYLESVLSVSAFIKCRISFEALIWKAATAYCLKPASPCSSWLFLGLPHSFTTWSIGLNMESNCIPDYMDTNLSLSSGGDIAKEASVFLLNIRYWSKSSINWCSSWKMIDSCFPELSQKPTCFNMFKVVVV